MVSPLRVYIGWDKREPIAYDVAKFSLERRATIPVDVQPIKIDDLRARKLYWRDQDPLASTEFTYTRFLTPALADFRGWALFCDCRSLARRHRRPRGIHEGAESSLLRSA